MLYEVITDARLKNYPGYFQKVLNRRADKRDNENLAIINDICIFNEKTKEWENTLDIGVLSKIYTLTDYINILKKVIENKNTRAEKYQFEIRSIEIMV